MRQLINSSKYLNYNRVSTSNYTKLGLFKVYFSSVCEIVINKCHFGSNNSVQCNLCNWRGTNFVNFYTGYGHVYRKAVCPKCHSHPRHRSYAISIKNTLENLDSTVIRVLHFSPERQITEVLCSDSRVDYLSVDIDHRKAMRKEDIRNLSFKDNSFDFIVCMHVFEHIDDDKKAMREIHRILKPTGVALLDVPIDYEREDTYEDASITTPEGRTKAFLQWDHLRLYGKNYPDVLREQGFTVTIKDIAHDIGKAFTDKHGLDLTPNYFGYKQTTTLKETIMTRRHSLEVHDFTPPFKGYKANKIDTPNGSAEIYTIDNFLSSDECQDIVDIARKTLKRSMVTIHGEKFHHVYDEFRTSKSGDLYLADADIAHRIDLKICKLMGISPKHSEPIEAQWYDVNQEFRPHYDWFPEDSPGFEAYVQHLGQRTWTVMIYLNDVEQGGQTLFTELLLACDPKPGMAVIWNNLKKDGSPNPATMHWGRPVEEGYKVIVTKWFREKGKGPFSFEEFIKENPELKLSIERLETERATC